jgi:DNA polymerase (family 10)
MLKPMMDLLEEIKTLMELKGENPFKVRAFEKAAQSLEAVGEEEDWVGRAKKGTLTELPGIGKGISEVLTEFILKGQSSALEELKSSLPEGLIELTQVPGLGPKKAMILIEELQIKTIGELEYACRENRLLKLKGFGDKLQAKILEGIEFISQTRGQQRLADVFPSAEKLLQSLAKILNETRNSTGGDLTIVETGELRRRMETLSRFDFLVETLPGEKTTKKLEEKLYAEVARFSMSEEKLGLPVYFHFATRNQFGSTWVKTTGSDAHWGAVHRLLEFNKSQQSDSFKNEEEFYSRIHLPWIPPEMRETGEEIELAKKGKLDQLLPWNGILGVFHNHTSESDGTATLEQMVKSARDLGYRYIGISDHSQSAFYAQGLTPDRLKLQEKEVKSVQEKYPDIRIFWGIESDILADGSLDYPDSVLSKFDFVIGSIHSRFQMDRSTMTERMLQAIRHPKIRFIGHLTGRLLLGRKGYELDVERVIEEAAKYKVAIEINAHPQRMDIDWRYGSLLRKTNCMVSVNPDAHSTGELENTKYGILVARKALLSVQQVLNSKSVSEVEAWLKRS